MIVTPALTPIDAIVRGGHNTQCHPEDIREIRRLRGEKTQDEIADEFGTTQQISRISNDGNGTIGLTTSFANLFLN